MTERLHFCFSLSCTGEGNGNPPQCSCLENPRDGGAWWAAVYGVAQSWTRLKRLSSSSSSSICKNTKKAHTNHVFCYLWGQITWTSWFRWLSVKILPGVRNRRCIWPHNGSLSLEAASGDCCQKEIYTQTSPLLSKKSSNPLLYKTVLPEIHWL